jgi:hypothetical protein
MFLLCLLQSFRGCANGMRARFLLSNQQQRRDRLSRREILCDVRTTGGLSSWKIQPHNSADERIILHGLCRRDEGQRGGQNKPSARMWNVLARFLLRRWLSDPMRARILLSIGQQRGSSMRSRSILRQCDEQSELSRWPLGEQSWTECGESMCGVSLWHLPQRIDWSTDCLVRLHSLSRRSLE